jgi:hypothetical protein
MSDLAFDLWDVWWSRDGAKVFGTIQRRDPASGTPGANYQVVEVPSGRVIATVCNGDPRAACP